MSNSPLDPNGGCPYVPGSSGKICWLRRRERRGWAMQHPDDATFDDVQQPVREPTHEPVGGGNIKVCVAVGLRAYGGVRLISNDY